MKRIRGHPGPMSGLAAYQNQAGADASWEEYRRRHAGQRRYRKLLEDLAGLQHGLCAYCEIDLYEGDRQVEHVVPVSHSPAHALDPRNLIACCRGGASDDPNVRLDTERFSPREESCGHVKGDNVAPEFVDPRTLPALPSLTRVRRDGRIEADTDACDAAGWSADNVEKTIRILGLNVQRLRRARRDYWSSLVKQRPKYRSGLNPNTMENWARSRLLPHNGVLSRFFTTTRSYFGELGERVLAGAPRDWI